MAGKSQLEKAAEEAAMLSYEQVEELHDNTFEIHHDQTPIPYDFKSMIKMRAELTATKDMAESQLKEINDQLLLAMRAADQQKVKLWDGMKLEVRNGTSPSKIEATKLLEHGVPLETIQAATTPGTPYQFVMVVKPKS